MSDKVIKCSKNENLSCDDAYKKMKQATEFKINKNVKEEMLFNFFLKLFPKTFQVS